MCYKVLRWTFVYFYLFDIRYIAYDLWAFDCILLFYSSNLLTLNLYLYITNPLGQINHISFFYHN